MTNDIRTGAGSGLNLIRLRTPESYRGRTACRLRRDCGQLPADRAWSVSTGRRRPRRAPDPGAGSGKAQETIQAANRALTVAIAQYRAGTTAYLTVITEQAVLLGAQEIATRLLTRRLASSVLLIEALGGGWETSKVPGAKELSSTSN